MKRRNTYQPAFVGAAAKREVSRQRLDLSQALGLEDYPEKEDDLALLRGDCPSLRKLDREALRAA